MRQASGHGIPCFRPASILQFRVRWVALATVMMSGMGCVTIPRAAPELSSKLGERIEAIQGSHSALLRAFFDEKRKQVDRFLFEEWLPVFAGEVFKDPKTQATWKEIASPSGKDEDRVRFLMVYGPRLQAQINEKQRELYEPLAELERALSGKLQEEYAQTKELNRSITYLLESSAKLSERQDRIMERAGVSKSDMDGYLNDADAAVKKLLAWKAKGEEATAAFDTYKAKLNDLVAKAKH